MKGQADGKCYRKIKRLEGGASDAIIHLNKLENSSGTEDVNTHIERVTLHINQNKF